MKATGRGISAPPGLKGFSFHLQPADIFTRSAFVLKQPGQSRQPTGSCCQPLGDISNLLLGKDEQVTVGAAGKEHGPARPMEIVFQGPTKHESRSSYFALLTPAAGHVAALCLQPLLRQAPMKQELAAGRQAAGTADMLREVAGVEQGQPSDGHIILSSHQCLLQDFRHDLQEEPTHLIGSTHISVGSHDQLAPC